MNKKMTGMTYADWCDNLLIVEVTEDSLWVEDSHGAYHFDGENGVYYEDGKNSRNFLECSDKVINYLFRLYVTRRGLED